MPTARWAILAIVGAAAVMLAAPACPAHPVPIARAVVQFESDGTYRVTLNCDVAALVMQTAPGHLGPLADELKSLPIDEVRSRLEDARRAFAQRLVLRFDGVPAAPEAISFPAAGQVQQHVHEHDTQFLPIEILGRIPAAAHSWQVVWPADVGRVSLAVRVGEGPPVSQTVEEGQPSWPVFLSPGNPVEATPTAPPTTPRPAAADRSSWQVWLAGALLGAVLGMAAALLCRRSAAAAQPAGYSSGVSHDT